MAREDAMRTSLTRGALAGGVVFVCLLLYKSLKYPGSFNREGLGPLLTQLVAFALVGGLAGIIFGQLLRWFRKDR
jgi:hypothetical protein